MDAGNTKVLSFIMPWLYEVRGAAARKYGIEYKHLCAPEEVAPLNLTNDELDRISSGSVHLD